MLREHVRQHDNVAALLPDSFVDVFMAAQYGSLSPGRCVALLVNSPSSSGAAGPASQQSRPASPEQQAIETEPVGAAALCGFPPDRRDVDLPLAAPATALKETVTAINECRARRLSGELKTYAESAQCSNPRIIQAFSVANYQRMYLIVQFMAKRLQLSEKVDRHELTEIDARLENAKLFIEIVGAADPRLGY
jgi:hypothetical protein